MKTKDFDRIVSPVYLIFGLISLFLWMKYDLKGLLMGFGIGIIPLIKASDEYYYDDEKIRLRKITIMRP
ncbi:MAG: hypothetical protein B6U87_00005 [Candidatus Aenigmarchaeota archaeon ex4484_52]|nr:MAG: hypothetical protein B6U87_00005 [Candidatus Aenigmarchaeota archaeon ex4484_52]